MYIGGVILIMSLPPSPCPPSDPSAPDPGTKT